MNVEDNYDSTQEEPRKSGKGLFACGGIGCILLLLACGGGIAAVFTMAMPLVNRLNEAQAMVSENDQVIEALGDDLTFGQPSQRTKQDGDQVKIEMDLPVSGSKASGTAKMILGWKSFSTWDLESLKVETEDGQTIDVLNSSEFNLDVDDGMDDLSVESELTDE